MPLGFISASGSPVNNATGAGVRGEFSQGGIGINSVAVYAEKILDFSPRADFCGGVEWGVVYNFLMKIFNRYR